MAGTPSILDPPSLTWRALRTFWLVLRLRCPSCGLARLSDAFLSLHRCCGACGVVFERDPGEVTGGMWINSMATTLGISALAAGLAFSSRVPQALATPIVVAFAAVFPILFYRHSRALWIGLLHLTGLVHRDEAADPEPCPPPWPSPGRGGGPPAAPDREEGRAPVAAGLQSAGPR